METRRTTCNRDCPDACSILVDVEDGRVVRLRGDPDHPVTRGRLCWRTSRFLHRQYSSERVVEPLYRESLAGDFRRVSWDAALDVAAERLSRIRRESGPEAVMHYRSGGSLGLLLSVVDLFFERFGPVTVKRGDVCSGAGKWAQEADFGVCDSSDHTDLLNARNVVLWGKNPAVSSPHLVPLLRGMRAAGAGVLLIDPVRHESARLADAFVQVRPGGDLALAMAAARVLLDRGWADPGAAGWCDGLDRYLDLVCSRPITQWCAEAGVVPAQAEDLARRLGPGRPATILLGWGLGRKAWGAATVRAVDALAALSANLGVPGAGVSFYFRRRAAFSVPVATGARSIPEPLLGPELLRSCDPPVRAVWVTAGNPVAMLPGSATVAKALRSREFVVVVDTWLSDTARCAHLVLPTTTLLESDDLLGSYGHHWIGVSRPAVERPAGVRSDLEIVQGLAARLGLADTVAGTARQWKRRMVEPLRGQAGVTLEDLEAGPVRNPLAPRVLFEGRVFPTPTGRVRLLSDLPASLEDAGRIADRPAGVAPTRDTDGFPLVLMALSHHTSQGSQWAAEPPGPPEVFVHPDSAAGLGDGAEAVLESAVASIRVVVRHDGRVHPEVLLARKGGSLFRGHCANALVPPALTDAGGGGVLYDERVRLRPAA